MTASEPSPAPSRTAFSWRTYLVLVAVIPLTMLAVLPYALTLQGGLPAEGSLGAPLWVVVTIQIVTQWAIIAALTALGLFLAGRIGLGLPILTGWLHGQPVSDRVRAMLLPSIAGGVAAGVVILLLAQFVFGPLMTAHLKDLGVTLPSNINPPPWQGFLASFEGGILEEIELRLVLLTLLAWLGKFVSHTADGRPTLGVLWAANVVSALLFGAGHLPTAAAIGMPLDTLVLTQILTLNGLAGLVFGWLYWRFGLESAMVAHFSTDIVLHVIAAALIA